MSDGLSWYIIIITVANILAMVWLIWWSGKGASQQHAQGDTMGHTWDGDLQEFNNPLPRWWLWLFYGTIIFGFIYLALFPGLGKFGGAFAWSQEQQWEQEVAQADAKYGPIFAQYAQQDLAALAGDPEALQIGKRLYLNYCSTCHGSDAGGATGFPNLTDGDWLYGAEPHAIKQTILNGRRGVMPAFGASLQEEGVKNVTAYILQMAGRTAREGDPEKGKQQYAMCMGCHGPDGRGNQALGAPNLTDDIWLYGASEGAIHDVLNNGRQGVMPAFQEFLGEDKVHLVSAYILSLAEGAK